MLPPNLVVDNPLLQPRGIQATALAATRIGLIGGTPCGAFTAHNIDGVSASVFPQEASAEVAVGVAHVNGVLLQGPGQQGAEQEEEGGGWVAAFAHHRVVLCWGVVSCTCQNGDDEWV